VFTRSKYISLIRSILRREGYRVAKDCEIQIPITKSTDCTSLVTIRSGSTLLIGGMQSPEDPKHTLIFQITPHVISELPEGATLTIGGLRSDKPSDEEIVFTIEPQVTTSVRFDTRFVYIGSPDNAPARSVKELIEMLRGQAPPTFEVLEMQIAMPEQIDRLLKLPTAARGMTTGPRVPIEGFLTTAPRDAVRPRNEAQTEAEPKDRSLLYAAVGAGGVVLLGLIGFLLYSFLGKAPEKPRAAKPPKTAPQPVLTSAPTPTSKPERKPAQAKPKAPKLTPLERKWHQVKLTAEADPDGFERILKRYQQMAEQAAGTPLADEIDAEVMAVEARYDAAAQKAWQAAEIRMGECVATGDYDTALAVMQALPTNVAGRLAEGNKQDCGKQDSSQH